MPLEVLGLAPHVDDLGGRALPDQRVQLGDLDDLERGRRRRLGDAGGRGSGQEHGAQDGQNRGKQAAADGHTCPPRIGSMPSRRVRIPHRATRRANPGPSRVRRVEWRRSGGAGGAVDRRLARAHLKARG